VKIIFVEYRTHSCPTDAFITEVDDFHVHRCKIYWLCPKTLSESAFSGAP
jgi:hypothetical protein